MSDMKVVTLKIAIEEHRVPYLMDDLKETAGNLPGIVIGLSEDKPTSEDDELIAKLGQ